MRNGAWDLWCGGDHFFDILLTKTPFFKKMLVATKLETNWIPIFLLLFVAIIIEMNYVKKEEKRPTTTRTPGDVSFTSKPVQIAFPLLLFRTNVLFMENGSHF